MINHGCQASEKGRFRDLFCFDSKLPAESLNNCLATRLLIISEHKRILIYPASIPSFS